MKIVAVGYRNWALSIYKQLKKNKKLNILIIDTKKKLKNKKIIKFNPKFVLFYGWSWKVSKVLIDRYKCVMLHPSKLPQYRGGSPIQNQIIDGKKISSITLFKMNNKIDAGNIILQKKFLLTGSIEDIFNRMTKIGILLTKKMLSGKYREKKQPTENYKVYKRRKPEQSEITLKELKEKKADFLFNKIRMLEDPYPNAFIRTKDGKKLIIKKASIDK